MTTGALPSASARMMDARAPHAIGLCALVAMEVPLPLVSLALVLQHPGGAPCQLTGLA